MTIVLSFRDDATSGTAITEASTSRPETTLIDPGTDRADVTYRQLRNSTGKACATRREAHVVELVHRRAGSVRTHACA